MYAVEEIISIVSGVAAEHDIIEIRLFGSYASGMANSNSDIDLIVKYGKNCRGLERIHFMNQLEEKIEKKVDVVNADFMPDFLKDKTEKTTKCIYVVLGKDEPEWNDTRF